MASNSLLFTLFDSRRDKIALYLERFNAHCKVLGIDDSKK